VAPKLNLRHRLADEHFGSTDYSSSWGVDGVVARLHCITGSGGWFSADHDGGASEDDFALVAWWFLEGASLWNVGGNVHRHAVNRGSGFSLNHDV